MNLPDIVPTPITRHSTRASRVKVGPKTAIPLAIFSLTSSCRTAKKPFTKDWHDWSYLLNPQFNVTNVDWTEKSGLKKNEKVKYLWVGTQSKLGQSTCFWEVNQQQKEWQGLTVNINTKYKHIIYVQRIFQSNTSKISSESDTQMYILEACQLLVQEVNHNRAEHKTGEYCEKSCNAWNEHLKMNTCNSRYLTK